MNLQELCDRPNDCPCDRPFHLRYQDRLWTCATNGHALILLPKQELEGHPTNTAIESRLDKLIPSYKEGAETAVAYRELIDWAKPPLTYGLLANRIVDRRLLTKWLPAIPLRDSTVLLTTAGARDPLLFHPYSDEWRLYIMPCVEVETEGPGFAATRQLRVSKEGPIDKPRPLRDYMGRPVDQYGQLLSLRGWETDETDA